LPRLSETEASAPDRLSPISCAPMRYVTTELKFHQIVDAFANGRAAAIFLSRIQNA
jgi:hypothetical protein